MPKLKKSETLWIHSMGKRFAVTGIYQTDQEANEHCAKHEADAVIAVAAGFVFVACKYAGVREAS